jgi:hypothetical protein
MRSTTPALLILVFSATTAAAQQPAACPGADVVVDTSVLSSPYVHMRLGTREGYFLLDTGATYSTVDAKIFGLEPGSKATIEGSSFPTITGGMFAAVDLSHFDAPGGREAGVIGTDFLSLRTIEFRYDTVRPYAVVSTAPCPARSLEDAGFVAIPQHGHYAADLNRLQPGMDNIPVIFLRIGGVIAPAWIDSGFGEGRNARRGVVQVNEQLFRKLREAGVAMQARGTISNVDCQGTRREETLWQVQHLPLAFGTREGQAIVQYGPPLLQVKPEVTGCGTVAARKEPFALIGAVYLLRWGATVFDPFSERVWISGTRASASPEPPYRAMTIAANKNGSWVARVDDLPEQADTRTLAACNAEHGECSLTASVGNKAFSCLALARSPTERHQLATAARASWEEARGAALAACNALRAGECRLDYARCNE